MEFSVLSLAFSDYSIFYDIRTWLAVLAYSTSIVCFLSPLSAYERHNKKSREEFFEQYPGAKHDAYGLPGTSHIAGWLSCLIMITYGNPFVSSNNLEISLIHLPGLMVETFYIVIFFVNASHTQKEYMTKLLMVAIVTFVMGLMVPILTLEEFPNSDSEMTRREACGIFGIIITYTMTTTYFILKRLAEMEHYNRKSIYLIEFSFFVSQISWAIYGLLGEDYFVLMASILVAVGCIAGSFVRSSMKQTTPEEDGSYC